MAAEWDEIFSLGCEVAVVEIVHVFVILHLHLVARAANVALRLETITIAGIAEFLVVQMPQIIVAVVGLAIDSGRRVYYLQVDMRADDSDRPQKNAKK